MEKKRIAASGTRHFSGEGTISGPGKSGHTKTTFIIAASVFLMLLTGGAFLVQNNSTDQAQTPESEADRIQMIRMETFTEEQLQNPVTPENAAGVIGFNRAELQYGLDQNSVNDAVVEMFADNWQ